MQKTAARPQGVGQHARRTSGTRVSALHGASGLALGRGLARKALPGMVAAVAVFSIPQGRLSAWDGRTGVAYVRVQLGGDAMSATRDGAASRAAPSPAQKPAGDKHNFVAELPLTNDGMLALPGAGWDGAGLAPLAMIAAQPLTGGEPTDPLLAVPLPADPVSSFARPGRERDDNLRDREPLTFSRPGRRPARFEPQQPVWHASFAAGREAVSPSLANPRRDRPALPDGDRSHPGFAPRIAYRPFIAKDDGTPLGASWTEVTWSATPVSLNAVTLTEPEPAIVRPAAAPERQGPSESGPGTLARMAARSVDKAPVVRIVDGAYESGRLAPVSQPAAVGKTHGGAEQNNLTPTSLVAKPAHRSEDRGFSPKVVPDRPRNFDVGASAAGETRSHAGAGSFNPVHPGALPTPGAATAGPIAAADPAAVAGERLQGEPVLVRLGALVDMLSDQFDPADLARIAGSHATDTHLPIADLQAEGIPVVYDPLGGELVLGMLAPQSAAGAPAGSGVGIGGGAKASGLRQSLAATASAGFDSNPFLASLASPEAASVRLQLEPRLSRSDERNSVSLTGRLEHIEYLGQYDSLQNYGADLAATRRVNERLEINAGALFQSNILATNLANPFFNGDVAPGAPLPPAGNDITVLGQGQRRTQFGADAGLRYVLSERDQLAWSINARADRFGTDGLIDSNLFAQQLQYVRKIDEGLTVGALVGASYIDFTDAALGDAQTLTPQAQVTALLISRLELSASLGVAITRITFGGVEETDTSLAGNLSLCRKAELSNLCLTGSRQVLPAGIGGALIQTTGGVSYSLRISERDSLQVGGNYSKASPVQSAQTADFDSVNGFVRYERRLAERFRLFASAGYLRPTGNRAAAASNFQGLIGVTFDLGNAR